MNFCVNNSHYNSFYFEDNSKFNKNNVCNNIYIVILFYLLFKHYKKNLIVLYKLSIQ